MTLNNLEEQLYQLIKDREALNVPARWSLVGGRIAMPPKLTPEQWREQYEHSEQDGDEPLPIEV